MIGFPGAYASFYDLVDQHGILFTRAPMSMGEDNRRMIHIQPVAAQPKAVGPNPVGGTGKKGGK